MSAPITLIINSAFTEPAQHWAENPDRTLRIAPGRRPAGYEIIDTRENTRRTVNLPWVDDIRQRVKAWRAAGYPGATEITRELLRHWWDEDGSSRRPYRFYHCQLEAANYYDEFDLCPSETLRQRLNRMEILVENWHTLMPLKTAERSVVRKGAESDEAYARRVLGKLAQRKDLLVINDEAHHAWRAPADVKVSRKEAEELGLDLEEATRWIEGLDRLHKKRRIQRCFDLSATPFAPTRRTNTEAGLLDWVVSDFGLNDAIEAGLVKTPRVVARDGVLPNAATMRPKLYHLYREPEVAQDLNRRGAEYVAEILDAHPAVAAWAKNDHLGFQILYLWNGSRRKFVPDFLLRYRSGRMLVLEVKGEDSPQDEAKRAALRQWTEAVNAHGGFGTWTADVLLAEPARARDVIDRHT